MVCLMSCSTRGLCGLNRNSPISFCCLNTCSRVCRVFLILIKLFDAIVMIDTELIDIV